MSEKAEPCRDYFDWQVKNGHGFLCEYYDNAVRSLTLLKEI
jgi:hypothetical protein